MEERLRGRKRKKDWKDERERELVEQLKLDKSRKELVKWKDGRRCKKLRTKPKDKPEAEVFIG